MPLPGSALAGRRRSPPSAGCGKDLCPDTHCLSRSYAFSGSRPWPLVAQPVAVGAAVTEPVIVEVTTLLSLFAEAAATGLPGSSVPLAMRDRSGCEWLVSASLNPFTQRFVGRAEAKQCGAIKQPVSGYLVGMDDLTGLQAECHDQWRNEIGSTMCLAAGLPNGTPGRIVVQAN